MNTKNMLNAYADLQDQKAFLGLKKQELIDQVLTEEVKQQLDDIDFEFAEMCIRDSLSIADVADKIKFQVISEGASVKGERFRASFVKGRVTWNTKALEGYVIANPEINVFRKVGNPSVRLAAVR